MKHTLYKIVLPAMFAAVVLLSGCGGGNTPPPGSGFQSPYTNDMYPAGTVINGYVLPPEPDHDENDKTQLGIDVNDNGMRDDIERYIIIKESENSSNMLPKVWTSVELQEERATQIFWKTHDITEHLRGRGCYYGVKNYLEDYGIDIWSPGSAYYKYRSKSDSNASSLMYNTSLRNSGIVMEALNHTVGYEQNISACDDNLTALGELP